MKKRYFLFWCLLFVMLLNNRAHAQEHRLVKQWQTDSVLKTPESVLFDGTNHILYFSNIDGDPGKKDGKGSIGKLGTDGKIISIEWVKGLNAPKGLGRHGNTLYVADMDEVVVIDIGKAAIVNHIPVSGAQFLNDITVDANGVIYVSDTKTGNVHRIENGKVSTWLTGINGVNGLLAVGDDLYILGNGILWKATKDKKKQKIADGMDASTDGIEQVRENEFLVSCWNGIIYYVKADGSKQPLLDTRTSKINTADIGYNPAARFVYVPTFFKNSVAAYQLK